ncbi:solute carrier family 22 member 18-like [Mercenaria mercenaria]|uniref:solute carrier family 22 member 18-like n=1 Tax=Mercenaria mercenaria TaxID=6596 RepID=UPI00234EE733|nr:solute carrier family 22 member 18-like [Mercenaria mercenaria]XP_045181174.2 solute carrier family 22 member 18-like [Mercenaria mercenaria]XP_045181175.2 solute carrier family 22 member 18-like [Mercenaria mercenaria]XP_045181176.2 solute carrier family 22 member 18-like [Mercenaria mercenaria]
MSGREDGSAYQRITRSNENRSDNMTDSKDLNDQQNLLNSEKPASNMENKRNEIHLFGWTFNKVILLTHVNIFLYSACFWIQTGTLPYLSKKLGVNAVWYGYLQTTFAIVQLAGGPLYGRFGDLFGSRAAMTLAFVSAALSYLLLSVSTSVPILFLSRLPSVFMHAMQGGQMIVTDLGDSGKRADALGKLGLSYGVGMVVGPVVGGLITKFQGLEFAAFVAFLGSVLSICLVVMFVPKQTKKVQVEEKGGGALLDWRKWLSLIMAPGALFLLILRVATGIPIGIFQSMFQVVALETFNLPADQNGYLMAYIGILTMIVQGVGVGIVLKKVSENAIMKWASFLLVWSYLSLSYVSDIVQLCVVLAPLTISLASQNIVISSALTRTVDEVDTGAMLGLNMATNSLIRTVSPTIGGIMLENLGFSSFGYLGFLSSGIVTAVLFIKFRNKT